MNLLGKLGPDAIPYDPIVLVTVAMMILGGIAVVAGITYFKKMGLPVERMVHICRP
jgi:cytochrome o ubiquinol oxidase subunit 1